ncbi:MAG: hypothetical protein RLZZ590_1088, partial [Actinomycetota bacterium]|jgi:hypothetical protein
LAFDGAGIDARVENNLVLRFFENQTRVFKLCDLHNFILPTMCSHALTAKI